MVGREGEGAVLGRERGGRSFTSPRRGTVVCKGRGGRERGGILKEGGTCRSFTCIPSCPKE